VFEKTVVHFPAEGGIELSAWLFVPDNQAGPYAAITMAHGYAGTNKVTVRSTRWARMYAPGDFIERVSPTQLLMVVADHDHVALTDLDWLNSAIGRRPA
jgi:hypothetical protein